MRRAMDLIHYVVKDGVLESTNDRSLSRQVSLTRRHETRKKEIIVDISVKNK
jgi:hypothetical protein